MVIIDRDLCACCGSCVSVCPAGALTLRETWLSVDEGCVDCDACLRACPMGALRPGPAGRALQPGSPPDARPASDARSSRLRRRYDLVVVGAGPAGATAARVAAEAGLSVLLLEKRQEIGSPVRCAEGVGHEPLQRFIDPDPGWIAAVVTQAEITAVAGQASRTLRATGGRGYILERRIFDRVLAERAAQAGAEVRVKTAVSGLLLEQGRVRGVRVERGDLLGAGQAELEAEIVIAADGVEGLVGRWAGLDLALPLRDSMVCVQYLLAGVDVDPTCTCYTIDQAVAPGGYAWVFPKGQGKANVGLGVQADLWQEEAATPAVGRGTVLGYLTRFIEARPHLARGYPVTLVAGGVPVAPAPGRLVTGGLMVVGDAARQVDPLTGGGIANAMAAGQLAAQVAVEAVEARDPSAAFLARYEERWQRSLGRKMLRNYRLRQRFAPAERTDEHFLRAFALAVG